jgi:hypothetical protein
VLLLWNTSADVDGAPIVEIQHSQPELLFVVAKDKRGRLGS